MRRTAAKLATVTAVVTAAALTIAPGSASADLVTHCVGTGGAVTVPNDLLVPAGQSCALTGTTITGNVSVAAGANLVVTGGHISGEIQVAADGYLDAGNTDIGGGIDLASGGYGVFLRDTGTGSITVRPKGSATVDSFLFTENAGIDGTVTAGAGEVRLDRSTEVTGNVGTTGTYYTDVHDSFVDGTLSVLNSATGSVVCGSAVRGRATFAGNLGGVQLGPNGTLDGCASGGYWGRDVTVSNTRGGVTVDDNIIDGRLTTTANTPAAQVSANNRVRGGVAGEQGPAAARALAQRKVEDREAKGERRATQRTSGAVQEAVAAGDAGL